MSEDQHSVGEFGSDCSDESLGVSVGLWTAGWDLEDLDPGVGEDGVEGGGELSCSVADQEPEIRRAVAEVGDEVTGLLGGPGSVGIRSGAEDVNVAGVDLDHEEHVGPLQRDGAVDVEEVAGKHRRCLGAEELSPGCPVCSGRRWRYS